MNKFQKFCMVIFALLVTGLVIVFLHPVLAEEAKKTSALAPAPAAGAKAPTNEIIDHGWQKRCPKDVKDIHQQCEVFTRLEMKESGMRMAELAVGFPQEKGLEPGTARGVVILPLGILLEPGVAMKIDEGKPLLFKNRFCNNGGCFSYVNLDKDLLGSIRKGKKITFSFKSADGQDVNVQINLDGFEKTLKEIE